MPDTDYIDKQNEEMLIALGYKKSFPVKIRTACEWVEDKYPNSVLQSGTTHILALLNNYRLI